MGWAVFQLLLRRIPPSPVHGTRPHRGRASLAPCMLSSQPSRSIRSNLVALGITHHPRCKICHSYIVNSRDSPHPSLSLNLTLGP